MENENPTLDGQDPSQASGTSSSLDEVLYDGAEHNEADSKAPNKDDDEPLDNKERSRLGRRLSKFEDEFGSVKSQMSRIEQLLEEQRYSRDNTRPSAISEYEEEDEDLDRILTLRELRQQQQKDLKRSQEQRTRYQNDYLRTVKDMYRDDPDMHALVENEMLTNANEYPTYSDHRDGRSDAIANYWRARARVTEAKIKGSAPNVRGGSNAPTGVSTTTRQAESSKPRVKLDDVASKFARSMGYSDDDVDSVFAEK